MGAHIHFEVLELKALGHLRFASLQKRANALKKLIQSKRLHQTIVSAGTVQRLICIRYAQTRIGGGPIGRGPEGLREGVRSPRYRRIAPSGCRRSARRRSRRAAEANAYDESRDWPHGRSTGSCQLSAPGQIPVAVCLSTRRRVRHHSNEPLLSHGHDQDRESSRCLFLDLQFRMTSHTSPSHCRSCPQRVCSMNKV